MCTQLTGLGSLGLYLVNLPPVSAGIDADLRLIDPVCMSLEEAIGTAAEVCASAPTSVLELEEEEQQRLYDSSLQLLSTLHGFVQAVPSLSVVESDLSALLSAFLDTDATQPALHVAVALLAYGRAACAAFTKLSAACYTLVLGLALAFAATLLARFCWHRQQAVLALWRLESLLRALPLGALFAALLLLAALGTSAYGWRSSGIALSYSLDGVHDAAAYLAARSPSFAHLTLGEASALPATVSAGGSLLSALLLSVAIATSCLVAGRGHYATRAHLAHCEALHADEEPPAPRRRAAHCRQLRSTLYAFGLWLLNLSSCLLVLLLVLVAALVLGVASSATAACDKAAVALNTTDAHELLASISLVDAVAVAQPYLLHFANSSAQHSDLLALGGGQGGDERTLEERLETALGSPWLNTSLLEANLTFACAKVARHRARVVEVASLCHQAVGLGDLAYTVYDVLKQPAALSSWGLGMM